MKREMAQPSRLRRRLVAAAGTLAAFAAFAAPASASDVAELACTVEQLSPADRRALDRVAVTSAYSQPEPTAIIDRALDACAARYDWTAEERDDALFHTRASIGQAFFRRQLAGQRRLDVPAIERAVIADQALIQAAVEQRDNGDELAAFLKRSAPMLEPWLRRNGNNRVLINALGGLLATTAILEGSRIRFSRRQPGPGTTI